MDTMVKRNVISLYQKYYTDNNNEGLGQFIILAKKFDVTSALYPGSFVYMTPSFVFPVVTYIDTDKRAKAFFNDSSVFDYISQNKLYESEPVFSFYPEDYRKSTLKLEEEFDLLISQYTGFISHYCKAYLKVGGLLLVNNSHGDASMTSIDESYELKGVLNKRGIKYTFSDTNLDSYFIPKKEVIIIKEYLEQTGRGIGYTKSPTSYIFRKIR